MKDKGEAFFSRLVSTNGIKLIDLKNPLNNDFRVVSELTYKRDREHFRPDITILINGIPLGFIEVKKPNNENEGIQSEFNRMFYRSTVEEFIPYLNQMQILGFTNNLPYNDKSRNKVQGSFYTTPNGIKTTYNHFREEQEIAINDFISEEYIDYVLIDNNIVSIKNTNEFERNLDSKTPCNRFITSVYSKERLIKFIRYGIVYVNSPRDGLHKHVIRYPQLFAIDEMIDKLNCGMKRGVVWHTQGSGKTALAYFMTNVLRDYYQKKGIITKFYFVVDRLDLLVQASTEFSSRGMSIANINNREDFTKNIKSPVVVSNVFNENSYKETMNVVNIQKFTEDSTVDTGINNKIQRIYFLDEVHRGYKPKGTFLANLLGADPNGIFIGLTGTPILKKEFKTTDLFTGYIHKYYYNKSIADGYTLKIKKENISTQFRTKVRGMLDIKDNKEIPPKQWEIITKEPEFVEELCKYIIEDFDLFRQIHGDMSLGSMIVTSSSDQAKSMQEWFKENSSLKTALILYDEDDNKVDQEEFRGKKNKDNPNKIESKLEGVIVYNMLLTGFDAPRLKRLYLLRKIREHSLLQTLARVNRPYKDMKYGYVVDFVDITEEYEETNKRYLEELRKDMSDDEEIDIDEMFVDVKEVKEKLKKLENKLFKYMWNIENNLENFQAQIQPYSEDTLRELRADLDSYRECYNELRMAREDVSDIPIRNVNKAYYETSNRINLKYAERKLKDKDSNIDDIDFAKLIIEFIKTGEEDLNFTTENDILERVNKLTNALSSNLDKEDYKYIELEDRFKSLVRSVKFDGDKTNEINRILNEMDQLLIDIRVLNSENNGLISKYNGDDTCMRIHKRLIENYSENLDHITVYNVLSKIIKEIDNLLGGINASQNIIKVEMRKPVRNAFREEGIKLSLKQVNDIINLFIDDKFN